MNCKKKEHGIFEIEALKKWAYLQDIKIQKAKQIIAQYTQCPLFKEDINVLAYIAKIVIYSLCYKKIETIEDNPEDWVEEPNKAKSLSDYYSIEEEKIIIATSIKDSDNNPFYLIFFKNKIPDKQPWFFDKITSCTNHIANLPKCITDSIKTNTIDYSILINTSIIDWDHILSDKDKEKGIYRFPVEFQELKEHRRPLFMIIKNSIDTQKQNIKSTIRYDKNIEQIVSCHYLPLDFSSYGGTNHELYACLRKAGGPGNRIEIPSILTYDQVYSQLLEKPKIDHWTYALCKFEENDIKKENQELKEKLKSLEEKFNYDEHYYDKLKNNCSSPIRNTSKNK